MTSAESAETQGRTSAPVVLGAGEPGKVGQDGHAAPARRLRREVEVEVRVEPAEDVRLQRREATTPVSMFPFNPRAILLGRYAHLEFVFAQLAVEGFVGGHQLDAHRIGHWGCGCGRRWWRGADIDGISGSLGMRRLPRRLAPFRRARPRDDGVPTDDRLHRLSHREFCAETAAGHVGGKTKSTAYARILALGYTQIIHCSRACMPVESPCCRSKAGGSSRS